MNGLPATENFDRAAAIGQVILTARAIESRLHEICGGEVAGIHALTEILGSRLPGELKRRLHYLATIRNQAAHEADFALSPEEFATFRNVAAETQKELARLFPAAAGRSPASGANAEPDSAEPELEVERELYSSWAHKFTLLGYLPVVGGLNLLRLLLLALCEQIGLLLLILFYFSAIPMIVQGVRMPEDRGLLYVGAGTALAVYIATLLLACRFKIRGLPKIFYWVPGLHIGYLAVLWGEKLAWGKVLLASLGLGLLGLAGYAAWNSRWELAGYGLLAEWAASALASWVYPGGAGRK